MSMNRFGSRKLLAYALSMFTTVAVIVWQC